MCQLLDKKLLEGTVCTVNQEELCGAHVLSTQVHIT